MNKIISFLFTAILLSVSLPALSYSRINANNSPLTYVSSFVGDDLGVTGIVSPAASASPLCYSNAETVTATIKNFGTATIDFSVTPAVITLNVTGSITVTLTNNPAGTLAAGASMNVTFTPTINMSALGPYNFSVYSSLTGDVDMNNDTLPLQTRTCGLTAGTVTTTTPSFCGSGSPVLTYSNTTQSIQWEKATAAAGPWTSATVSTNYTVTMPSINVKTYYRVKLTCNGNLIYSNSVSVDVFALPVVTVATYQGGSPPPGPVHYCLGMNIPLYASSSVPATSYQWYKNGFPISGQTSNWMVISSYTGFLAGSYSVMITTADGCTAMSNITTVIVPACVAIPSSGKVCQGNSVQLTMPSSLMPFQWRRNGVFIPGATSNVYYATQSGTYSIWPSDACGGFSFANYPFTVTVDSIPVSTITPSVTQNICAGQSVLLTANTGTGLTYQWKKDGTNISGATGSTYSATAAGNYTVAETNTCGTINSAATTVTVNALPVIPNITAQGPISFCDGDSVILTTTIDTALTYQWKKDGINIMGASNSSYTVKSSGNYSLVVTNTFGCSRSSFTYLTITVNAHAAVITPSGPTSVCQGNAVILNANTGTGFTYQWKKNGVDIPGASGSSYNPTITGNYAVAVTGACNTVTSAATTVTINPLPTASVTAAGPTTFCNGGSVVLNALVNANYTYQWKKSGTNISGATSSSYTATATGTYKVSVTNVVTGCSKTTATAISVTKITPLASITAQGPTTFCTGGSVVLQANTGTGFSYKWKKNGSYISGATASAYTATKTATYKAEVTDGYGCSKISAGIVITVTCREGEMIPITSNEINATLFPNPYSETLTLLIDGNENELYHVSIKDVLGRTIETEKLINAGSEISLGEKLSPGFYLVELVSGDKRKMLRVEKMQ